MARDIEAEVKVKDSTGPGLKKVEENFRKSGKKVEQEYDRFGKSTGDKLLRGIGAVSPMLAKRLSSAFGDAASIGAPLLIAGIGAALPAMSALIGAAVTGGAAGAGILGGIALASRDARVKEAGTNLGQTLLAGLTDRAGSFVQPVLNSVKILEGSFVKSGAAISRIFQNSSRFVEPLARAIASISEDLISGLDIAIGRAGPVIAALTNGLKGTGEAVKGLIDDLSSNAQGNADVLEQTFSALNGTLTATGKILGFLSETFSVLNKIMPLSAFSNLGRIFDDTDKSARKVGSGTFGAAQGIQTAGDAAATAEKDAQLYSAALEENARAAQAATDAQRNLFDDTTKVGEAFNEAKEAAKKNGETLSSHTKKGQANREALSNLANTLNAYRSDLEKSGASTTRVNGVLNTQRSRLIAAAIQFGATKAQARAYANQLLGIPKKTDTTSKLNAAAAKREARGYQAQLNSIPRNVVTTVSVNVNASRLASVERRLARVSSGEFANGGSSFGLTAGGQTARTGGPLEVFSTVENRIFLDGNPFRQYVDAKVRASESRARHRSRYGGRHT